MIVYDVLCMLTSFTMSISYVFVRIYIYIYIYIGRMDSPDMCSEGGCTEIADLLVRSNADVNVKTNVRINTIYIVYIYHRLPALYIHTDIRIDINIRTLIDTSIVCL